MRSDRPPNDDLPANWLDIPDPAVGMPPSKSAPPGPREPSPLRSAVKARRVLALALSAFWGLALLARLGFRDEIGVHFGFVMSQTFLWSSLLVVAGALSLWRGRRGLGAPAERLATIAIGAPLLFMAVGLAWVPHNSPGAFGELGAFGWFWGCFGFGLITSLPMLLVSVWSLRRAFPSAAGWRGAALGAACGLAASVLLTLHCSVPFGGHIALAHGLPVVTTVILGALLASKWARA